MRLKKLTLSKVNAQSISRTLKLYKVNPLKISQNVMLSKVSVSALILGVDNQVAINKVPDQLNSELTYATTYYT
jgi:predicted amino acid-binding ACT domain protein